MALLLLEGVPRALFWSFFTKWYQPGPWGFYCSKASFYVNFGACFCILSVTQIQSSRLCCTSLELWFAVGNHDLLSTMSQNWHQASWCFTGGWLGKFFHLLLRRRVALWGFWLSSRVPGLSKSICYTHIVHEPQCPIWGAYTHLPFPHELLWHQLPSTALSLSSHFASRACTFPCISFDIAHALKFVLKC